MKRVIDRSIQYFIGVIFLIIALATVGGGPGDPPPPPVGPAAIDISPNGPVCFSTPTCSGRLWTVKNLRNDVGAFVTYAEYFNQDQESGIENYRLIAYHTVRLAPREVHTIQTKCSHRLQTRYGFCVGDYQFRKIGACTMDQPNCEELTSDRTVKKADCFLFTDFEKLPGVEKGALSELYNAIISPQPNYKFTYGITDLFGGCSKESITINNKVLEVSGSMCTKGFGLPQNVPIYLNDGTVDEFSSLYVTSPDFTSGSIKNFSQGGKLTFSTIEGVPYYFDVYLNNSKVFKRDILRTIEASNGFLHIKGDFLCFDLRVLPLPDKPKKKKK